VLKKEDMELDRLLVLNTLQENWLLSFSSPPPGEITERAAGCEKLFSTPCYVKGGT
jgi:hypothetical protein